MLTTVRHIFGRIMHSETALHSQWDKGRKNNLLFASPSIRRPTLTLSERMEMLMQHRQALNEQIVRLQEHKTKPDEKSSFTEMKLNA